MRCCRGLLVVQWLQLRPVGRFHDLQARNFYLQNTQGARPRQPVLLGKTGRTPGGTLNFTRAPSGIPLVMGHEGHELALRLGLAPSHEGPLARRKLGVAAQDAVPVQALEQLVWYPLSFRPC